MQHITKTFTKKNGFPCRSQYFYPKHDIATIGKAHFFHVNKVTTFSPKEYSILIDSNNINNHLYSWVTKYQEQSGQVDHISSTKS